MTMQNTINGTRYVGGFVVATNVRQDAVMGRVHRADKHLGKRLPLAGLPGEPAGLLADDSTRRLQGERWSERQDRRPSPASSAPGEPPARAWASLVICTAMSL